ncbi:hypothetical protein D3C75_1290440 [compost metagenome]
MATFGVQSKTGRVFPNVADGGNFFPFGGIDHPQYAFLRSSRDIQTLIFLIEHHFTRRDELVFFHAFTELDGSEFFTALGIDHRY